MSKNKMSDQEEEAFAKAKAILSEHFPNWAIIVIDDEASLSYDYTNYYISQTLCRETLSEMNKDDIELLREEVDLEDEDDGT